MALALDLIYSSLNDGSDCDNLIIDDNTGSWDVTTNPGGYQDEGGDASGNPKRSELALYMLLTKKNPEATDLDISYSNVDSSADTATSWTIPITTDGWYRAQMVAIPVYSASAAYAVGQLIWYSDALYRCAITTSAGESPVSAPSKWTATSSTIANIRSIYDDPISYGPTTSLYTTYLDFLQSCSGDKIYADAWKDVSDDRPSFFSLNSAMTITALLEGAKIAAARENFQEADRKILIVQDLSNNPNCRTC